MTVDADIIVGSIVTGRGYSDTTWSHEVGLLFRVKKIRKYGKSRFICSYANSDVVELFAEVKLVSDIKQ